jgi:heptosyltransferase-3
VNPDIERAEPSRVMIYRLGSIGDTAVALPCFKFIRARFPHARISLLTNHPRRGEAPVLSVIGPMDLVDTEIPYAAGERDPRALLRLMAQIREKGPRLVIYLTAYRGLTHVVRDLLFFRLAGVRRCLGASLSQDQRAPRPTGPDEMVEREAERLTRRLAPLGNVDVNDPSARDLSLTNAEKAFVWIGAFF